ncbi:hypothetical protein [Hymenobacter glacieicola]|uniref:Uncharacterized protein n=1 Tax=Hymenobacter glacieicola TaxID=1562124 RepID=A0ABQ1WJL6_9BACT|nr:hypothetical protein [Hymenobacter glacieicola]GGG33867.1 hypothetical protein GCM10011378_07910 [Hymenobacter glacieicola]
MGTLEVDKPIIMKVEVPEQVNKAIRNECLRRQLNGEKVTMKDIHKEWLIEKAAQVERAA